MLNEREQQLDDIFQHVAEAMDISPTDYKRAIDSYSAVGNWLHDGYQQNCYEPSAIEPDIYLQGSMRLGTVVRPIWEGKEVDFDVDLVCELQAKKQITSPGKIKKQVGDRLDDHGIYKTKLDEEGKRCWTLNYAKSEGIGFHIDVLPCIPDPNIGASITEKYLNTDRKYTQTTIAISDKVKDEYGWNTSNPRGFAEWFKDKNSTYTQYASKQKQQIFEKAINIDTQKHIFDSVDEVPDPLVHTPLQRAIQILKRHRDMRFTDNPEIKPISMIITRLAAELYQGETSIFSTLVNIVRKLSDYSGYVENRYFKLDESKVQADLIQRTHDGKWDVPNPVNPGENFADRWHEDAHIRAKMFFKWVRWVEEDLDKLLESKNVDEMANELKKIFGEENMTNAMKKYGEGLKSKRISGTLKMSAGTGMLGNTGNISVKGHTFYGKER